MGLLQLVKANSFYKLGFLIFQSLIILILSRLLGPDSFGIYSLIMVNATIFNLVSGWGVPSGIMYHASMGDMSVYTLKKISNWTLLIQLLICVVAESIFYNLKGSFWIWPTDQFQYALLGIIVVVGLSLMERSYAFFNGFNKILIFHKISFYFSLFIFIIVLSSFFSSVNYDWKYLITIIILIQLFQSIFSMLFFYFGSNFHLEANTKEYKKSVTFYNYSLLSFIANAFWLLVSKIDIIIISKLASTWDLGQYALASRFSQLFFIMPQFLAGILFPWFCSLNFNRNKFEILLRLILLIHFIMGIFIFIASDYFIPYFFGNQYHGTVKILLPILIGSASLSIQIILAAYFASQNRITINIKTMLICLIILLTLDLILIPILGILGAAISLALSYFIATIYAFKSYQTNLRAWNLIKPRFTDIQFIIQQFKYFKQK